MIQKKFEKQKYKITVMAVLLIGACVLTYYLHMVLKIDGVFTHLFYIPIILASLWWKRMGLIVSVFLGGILILNHLFIRTGIIAIDYYLRAFMFIVVGLVTTMSTERIAKANEALWKTKNYLDKLIRHANAPIVVWDPACRINRFNHAFEHLTGYTADEVIGRELGMLFPEAVRDKSLQKIVAADNGEQWESGEIPILCKDEATRLVLWNSANIYAKDGTTLLATIAQGIDVTERKKAEEQIRSSLKEKRFLLREIHHRVKNNMQIISSLLRLQSATLKDKETIDIFMECQNRVKSIALIHAKLYQSEDFTNSDFAGYIRELTHDLFCSYSIDTNKIVTKIDVEDISLGIDSAVPCGLLVNELISNCFKHAFPDGRAGEIRVSLIRTEKGQFELIVSDNGVGIAEDMDFRKTKSLGLRLITTLAEDQLHGKIELNRSAGTEFKITFTPPPPPERNSLFYKYLWQATIEMG